VVENGGGKKFLKTKREEKTPLEPIVAHGSRMSWTGILRPDDEFPSAARSQLAVLTAESGPPLRRHFGRWSGTYRRFTTNLTSAKIVVKALQSGQRPSGGILCVLHWVDRRNMVRSDKGGVCYGDGWPVKLWDAFVSESGNLPPGTIAEKLRSFAESHLREKQGIVAEWRARLEEGVLVPPEERRAGYAMIGENLLPTPATLVTDDGTGECVVSWAPWANAYRSLSEALASSEAREKKPDRASQAKYYLECTLAGLHGVKFRQDDYIEDEAYERTPEFLEVGPSFKKLERELIAKFGTLDRFGLREDTSA
jgi:hypothetical protein